MMTRLQFSSHVVGSKRQRCSSVGTMRSERPRTVVLAAAMMVTCLLPAGCAAPFGVRRASPEAVHRALSANVLSTGDLSNFSRIVLHRRNLTEAFDENPEGTLRHLHQELSETRLSDADLASLAELSFHYASRKGGRPHFLAAALYAYAYVFPEVPATPPPPYDPRQRMAMDLYNRALTEAFKTHGGQEVAIVGGTYALPFGEIDVSFDSRQLAWGSRLLTSFVPAAEIHVVGFENRYRQPGIGVPLAAATLPAQLDHPARDLVGPKVRVPVTALLRVTSPRQQLRGDQLVGSLELHPETAGRTTNIDGHAVPLEQEPTAALALTLATSRPWTQDLNLFLGRVLLLDTGPTFGGREPHRRGRIPVVFVHGTASNFSVWANMVNDLESDTVLRERFQFWFFRYDSGQPILYSGMMLRRALNDAVQTFKAAGDDPCLDQMVLIGHSQGGLLVKLTSIDSGDLFWQNVANTPFDEIDLPDKTRALLREAMFVEPLPYVKRVIFVATPHRGSYLAGPDLVRRLAQRLITLPADLALTGVDLFATDSIRAQARLSRLPTSIDNMSPGHPFITAISEIPIVPEVAVHSIIGVVGDDPIEMGGDGVVKYTSAHIDGAESEIVMPYKHSMQSKPEVVEEVQRILHRHLRLSGCAGE